MSIKIRRIISKNRINKKIPKNRHQMLQKFFNVLNIRNCQMNIISTHTPWAAHHVCPCTELKPFLLDILACKFYLYATWDIAIQYLFTSCTFIVPLSNLHTCNKLNKKSYSRNTKLNIIWASADTPTHRPAKEIMEN